MAVSTGAIAAATAGMVSLGVQGVNAFKDFEKGMNEVFTLLPDISGQAMKEMENQVLSFNNQVGRTSQDTIPALYQALSAGVPQDNVFEFLELANKAAVGGATELTVAVDGITSAVNAYGSDVLDATKASDLMFTAVRLGKTTMDEMASSLFNVTPTAAALGVAFEDVNAAIATITSQGVPTSVATTQMRQAFVELGDAGTEVSKIFSEAAGVSFKEFIAQGGNTAEAMAILEEYAASAGVGINELFGSVEAGNAALALTGANAEKFANNIAEMENASGATQAAFDKMNQGVQVAMNKARAAWETFLIKFGQAIAPVLVPLIDLFTGTIERITPIVENILNGVTHLLSIFISDIQNFGIQEAFLAIFGQGNTIEGMESSLEGMLFMLGMTRENAISTVDAIWGFIQGVLAAKDAIMLFLDPIIAWVQENVKLQDVLIGLGIAIASVLIPAIIAIASPIIAIAGTFALLVAGIALFRQAWESDWMGIKTIVTDFWENTLKPFFDNIQTLLDSGVSIWDIFKIAIVTALFEAWQSLAGWGEQIKTIFQLVLDWISTTWDTAWIAFTDFFKNLWDNIKVGFDNFKTGIETFFQGIIDWIVTNWDSFWQGFTDFFSGLWGLVSGGFDAFKTGVETVINGIISIVQGLINLIAGIPAKAQEAANAAKGVIEGVQNAAQEAARGYGVAASGVGQIGGGLLSGQYSAGQVGGAIANAFGFKQFGGLVSAGKPYVVGEKRPELFVPQNSGRIFPSISSGLSSLASRSGGFGRPQMPQVAPSQQQSQSQGSNNRNPITIHMNITGNVSDSQARESAYKLKRELQAQGFNIAGG